MRKLLVIGLIFLLTNFSCHQAFAVFETWTQVNKLGTWKTSACSATCEIMAAAESGGYFWVSSDAGSTWTSKTSAGSRSWTSIAISGDGRVYYGAYSGGYLLKSTDGGNTWTSLSNSVSGSWKSISTSSDGSIVIAATNGSGGAVYTSTNSGSTWTQELTPGTSTGWNAVAVAQDGGTLVATTSAGAIWRGSGSIGSWSWSNITSGKSATDSTNISGMNWKSVVIDSTGTKIAVVSNDLYFTNDSGTTWIHATGGNYNWQGVAGSSDLKTMVIVSGDNCGSNCRPHRVTTSNYVTFSDSMGLGSYNPGFVSVSMSQDGTRAIAATVGSYLLQSGSVISTSTTSLSAGPGTFRATTAITATLTPNTGGRVTFYANGKRIGGCVSILATSGSQTCQWKPTGRGSIQITARYVPSDSSYKASWSAPIQVLIANRASLR